MIQLHDINKTFNSIVGSYHKRQLGKLKVQEAKSKLTRSDIEFIHSSVMRLATDFNFNPEQIAAIQKISNQNELVQLKMLLALYRRVKPIVKQQNAGKTKI